MSAMRGRVGTKKNLTVIIKLWMICDSENATKESFGMCEGVKQEIVGVRDNPYVEES